MPPRKKKKKDFTFLYVATLVALVILLIIVVGNATKTGKFPSFLTPKNTVSKTQATAPLMRPNPYLQKSQEYSEKKLPTVTYKSVSNDNRVKYKIDRFKKLDVQPLEFEIFDENRKPYTPNSLQIIRGSKMHYIVVSANLNGFQHLYPTFEKGKWKVLANLPNPGIYYAFVDIAPVEGKPLIVRTYLTVQTPPSSLSFPKTTPELEAKSAGYKAKLKIASLELYQPNVLSFYLTKNEIVAKNIQQYLGAFGSLVLFRQGDLESFFMYAQPMANDPERGLVEFSTTFILPGRYTVFAEFKIGNKTVTFPFTFDIE